MILHDINITVWVWMAIYTFSMYITGFFLHMHVTMTKRQVVFFIPAIFVWTLMETYFTCLPSSTFQIIMCNAAELLWLLPTIYLFTDHFSLSLIRFSVISWIANGFSLLVLKAYDYEEYVLFSGKILNEISWDSVAVFALSVVTILILEYPVMQYLMGYRARYDRIYKAAAVLYLCVIVGDWIIEINAASEGQFIMRGAAKATAAVFLTAFIVLLVILIKQQNILIQKRQLESRIKTLNSQYEEVVARNRELHRVRHELNKQAEALRALSGYVPEMIRRNIMRSVVGRIDSSLAGMSLSGNMMLDTLLDRHCRELEQKGILLETVMVPMQFEKDVEDDIVIVQEEMFRYAYRFEGGCKWIRYSVRLRGLSAFIMIEIGFADKGLYKRQRLLNVIGDKLIFRQAFCETYMLLARHDGSISYELNKDGVVIGVMLSVESHLND